MLYFFVPAEDLNFGKSLELSGWFLHTFVVLIKILSYGK
nr:MAG TPA: hypothetical protein [Caudoviricetes sp.]